MLRVPAEWERQSAVQLTFPHADSDWGPTLADVEPVFDELARTIARYERVLIVCADADAVRRRLADVDPARLILVEAATNDTWARDHGGITVEDESGPVVLDFMFNGWGLKFPADKDNLLTRFLHGVDVFRVPVRTAALVLEGGGIESDGRGTLLTTAECLLSPNRNPHLSRPEIEAELRRCFGLERILWLEHGYLAGDDTDSHIDTLARFCDPDTIAYVRCTDPHDEHYAALTAMERELRAFRRADGQPYRLVPLPWPDACFAADGHRLPATYANFLIVNDAVLVPTYRVPQDEAALAVFHDLFPGRAVIGIDCRPLIEQHGSLHCVTMQYPAGVI